MPSARIRRRRAVVGLLGALLVADVVAVATLPGPAAKHLDLAAAAPSPAPASGPAPPAPPSGVPVSTLLATPTGTIPYSASPGGAPVGTVGTWYGYDLVMPVISQRSGWSQIRLPWRPNESVGWVQSSKVTFSQTPYYVRLSLTTKHLTVYKAGQPVMRFAVGIGEPATPTVTGQYFVAVHEPKPSALLGPVVLDLSAHSDAIQSWEGAGDAIIAIHGPVDSSADGEIGTTGARVSNGCVRLHLTDDVRMAAIPVGTLVDILG